MLLLLKLIPDPAFVPGGWMWIQLWYSKTKNTLVSAVGFTAVRAPCGIAAVLLVELSQGAFGVAYKFRDLELIKTHWS